jgi:hypothetical protein
VQKRNVNLGHLPVFRISNFYLEACEGIIISQTFRNRFGITDCLSVISKDGTRPVLLMKVGAIKNVKEILRHGALRLSAHNLDNWLIVRLPPARPGLSFFQRLA